MLVPQTRNNELAEMGTANDNLRAELEDMKVRARVDETSNVAGFIRSQRFFNRSEK